jgi:hypothetical protein
MSLVSFAGPSVPPDLRRRFPALDWRPPAEAGDLLRLEAGPELIVCLIDGVFDHRPAVRHKEILWLLAGGARMFGAASIGALRAAEMDGFGLIGVGAIYRAYRRGSLMGDDEVALVHAGAEWEWRALSVPLVDVRATLCAAVRGRALSAPEARALLRAARDIHYVDRDWPAILAGSGGGPPGFGDWLTTGAVPRKQLDAVACIEAALGGRPQPPGRPEFVRTSFFDALARELGLERGQPARPGIVVSERSTERMK